MVHETFQSQTIEPPKKVYKIKFHEYPFKLQVFYR